MLPHKTILQACVRTDPVRTIPCPRLTASVAPNYQHGGSREGHVSTRPAGSPTRPTLEYIHLLKTPVAAGCFFAAFARYAAAGPCGRLGQSEAQNQPVLTLVDCHPYGVSAKPCPRALSRPLSSCGQLILHGMARHFVTSLLLFPTEEQKRGGRRTEQAGLTTPAVSSITLCLPCCARQHKHALPADIILPQRSILRCVELARARAVWPAFLTAGISTVWPAISSREIRPCPNHCPVRAGQDG
jgi:hypothetical protein